MRYAAEYPAPARPAQSAALAPDADLLGAFLGTCSVEAFKRDVFRRKPAVFRAAPAAAKERVAALLEELHGGDVTALADDTASESIQAWLKPAGAGGRIDSIKVASGHDAATLHAAGASLYFRAPASAEAAYVPAMAECIDQSAFAYYAPSTQEEPCGEIEVFVSRDGHVTAWHCDFQENFTVQLRGRKRWRVKSGGGLPPGALRGATPHYNTVGAGVVEQQLASHRMATDTAGDFRFAPPPGFFDDADVIELGPGDCWYFPAGCWHQVEAVGDSLSINISLVGHRWADLLAGATRHMMWKLPAGRQLITLTPESLYPPPPPAPQGKGSGEGVLGALHASLAPLLAQWRAVAAALTPADLVPPITMLSKRYHDLLDPVAAAREEKDDDEEEDEEDEDDARAAAIASMYRPSRARLDAVADLGEALGMDLRGLNLYYTEAGTLVVVVGGGAAGGGAAAAGSPKGESSYRLNPLTTVLPLADIVGPAGSRAAVLRRLGSKAAASKGGAREAAAAAATSESLTSPSSKAKGSASSGAAAAASSSAQSAAAVASSSSSSSPAPAAKRPRMAKEKASSGGGSLNGDLSVEEAIALALLLSKEEAKKKPKKGPAEGGGGAAASSSTSSSGKAPDARKDKAAAGKTGATAADVGKTEARQGQATPSSDKAGKLAGRKRSAAEAEKGDGDGIEEVLEAVSEEAAAGLAGTHPLPPPGFHALVVSSNMGLDAEAMSPVARAVLHVADAHVAATKALLAAAAAACGEGTLSRGLGPLPPAVTKAAPAFMRALLLVGAATRL